MRGKEKRRFLLVQSARITPAYAGKSVCFFLILSKIMGSPPPMRGKGQGVLHFISPFRITPAYAGKRLHVQLAQVIY